MKREIKFRAFVNGKILHLAFHVSCQGTAWIWKDTTYTDSDILDAPIMQFTGLTDKKRRDIYEGDVIRTQHFIDTSGHQHYLKHRVVWSEAYTGWLCININNGNDESGTLSGNAQLWCFMKYSHPEVIGNIYENPELLTNQNQQP